MPFVNVNNGALFYKVHGTGSTKVLFISGLASGHWHWDWQVELLQSKKVEVSVCVFDNRGVGYSLCGGGEWSTKALAVDALELIQQLEWTNVHVVGVSMGGMIAQHLSDFAPSGMIKSMFLVNTNRGITIPTFKSIWSFVKDVGYQVRKRRALNEEEKADSAIDVLFPIDWDAEVLDLEKNDKKEKPMLKKQVLKKFLVDRFKEHPKQTGKGFMGQLYAASMHFVNNSALERLKEIPSTVVVGLNDCVIRPSSSRTLAKKLDSRLVELNNTGHLPGLQEPELFNQLLLQHLHFNNS